MARQPPTVELCCWTNAMKISISLTGVETMHSSRRPSLSVLIDIENGDQDAEETETRATPTPGKAPEGRKEKRAPPGTHQLDEMVKAHRRKRKKDFLDLTDCGPCCPCYNCVRLALSTQSRASVAEEEDVTDNLALAFSHLHRRGRRGLPDRPIITETPVFMKEFQAAMAEAREITIKGTIEDFFYDVFAFLAKLVGKLIICLFFPIYCIWRRSSRRRRIKVSYGSD